MHDHGYTTREVLDWLIAKAIAAVVDHGVLTGLGDDDHSQYALLAGRSGGQTLIGGTASGNSLTLKATSHATKGPISLSDLTALAIVVPDSTTAQQFSLSRTSDANAFYIHKPGSYEVELAIGGLGLWYANGNTENVRYGTNDATYFTNTHTMRGQVIIYGANTYAPAYRTALIVRGISGMTADLQEWQNSSSVKQAAIGAAGYLEMLEQSAPSTPSSGYGRLYPKTDNHLYYKDDAATETPLTKGPQWRTYDISYTAVAALGAVASGTVNVFTLPAGAVIHAVAFYEETNFTGTKGTTGLTVSVGISGTAAKYHTATDLFSATNFADFQFLTGGESMTATTTIISTWTASGGNLNGRSAGKLQIRVLWSQS